MNVQDTRRTLLAIWLLALSSVGVALLAGYLFLSAVATASLRFHHCGPTSLDHPEAACRIGTRLLLMSYGTIGLALVLAVMAFWLHRRRKRASKNIGRF